MNLSFLRYFKKDKAATGAVSVAYRPGPAIEKPASERFGKTVMPNSSRIVGLEPTRNFPVPAPFSEPDRPRCGRISLGGSASVAVAPITPGGDRTIALQLVDLVPHIPGGMLQPAEIDPQHRVLLKASEVERGMATGRPTVLLRAIYQQAPELFTSKVDAADKTEVALPLGKVLEQFAAFQVRDDQICDQAVPQVETPFLKSRSKTASVSARRWLRCRRASSPPLRCSRRSRGTIAAAQPESVAEIKPPTRSG